jgi:hypothetical protein
MDEVRKAQGVEAGDTVAGKKILHRRDGAPVPLTALAFTAPLPRCSRR